MNSDYCTIYIVDSKCFKVAYWNTLYQVKVIMQLNIDCNTKIHQDGARMYLMFKLNFLFITALHEKDHYKHYKQNQSTHFMQMPWW